MSTDPAPFPRLRVLGVVAVAIIVGAVLGMPAPLVWCACALVVITAVVVHLYTER